MRHGLSPAQLVYGFNPLLPTVQDTKPPVLSNYGWAKVKMEHLTALKSAREAFVKTKQSSMFRQKLNKENSSDGMKKQFRRDKVILKGDENPAAHINEREHSKSEDIHLEFSLEKETLHGFKQNVKSIDPRKSIKQIDMVICTGLRKKREETIENE